MKIYCKNTENYVSVIGGEKVIDLIPRLRSELPFSPICARVNNKTEDLCFPLYSPKQVEFLSACTPSGHRVYVRSLCMMLYKAVKEIYPDATLCIEHSMSSGYFCRLIRDGKPMEVDQTVADELLSHMKKLHETNIPYRRKEHLTKDVISMFRRQGLDEKVTLLETLHELYTTYYRLGDISDTYYGPLAPSTGFIGNFDIRPYKDGFLLFAASHEETEKILEKNPPQEKMYKAFTDQLMFNRVIQVKNVGELNMAVKNRRTAELINVAEAMHDKLLGRISDRIAARRKEGGAGIVLIAGPSSSGKTTSTKRLAIQLMTNLIVPKMISLDDYFVDREKTPLDADGQYDYEALEAIDIALFNDHLQRLMRGESVEIPRYDFITGRRTRRGEALTLDERSILIIEGIHGLNPRLTPSIPDSQKFRIYISCFTSVAMDNISRIATTDNRLLRRLIRDARTRGSDAVATLARWGSVRRGEEKHIFPYQENADVMLNSALFYELSVLRPYAEPLLREVPDTIPEYDEARRMLKFLDNFVPMTPDEIPPTSILREFIGGSSFGE